MRVKPSPYKLIAHLVCWLPFCYGVYGAFNRLLGADPQEALLELFGLWALIFLLLSLSITPIKNLFKLLVLVKYRRMLGLYSAFYLSLHLLAFFVFYLESNLKLLAIEFIERSIQIE